MGKRGKKVKGTPTEKKIIKLIEGKPSYSNSYIAQHVGVGESTVSGIRRQIRMGSPNRETFDPIRAEYSKEHIAELLCFGQRLRDRLSVDSPEHIVSQVEESRKLQMWGGSPSQMTLSSLPDSERTVEEEWGFLSYGSYDARQHTQFGPFEQHLRGHKCWGELQAFKIAYDNFVDSCHTSHQWLVKKLTDKAPSSLPPNLTSEDVTVIATALLADAWHGSRYHVPLFAPRATTTDISGVTHWQVGLGGWYVSRPTQQQANCIVAAFEALYVQAVSHKEFKTLIEDHANVVEHREAFRKSLAPDALLLKLLMNGRCDLCP